MGFSLFGSESSSTTTSKSTSGGSGFQGSEDINSTTFAGIDVANSNGVTFEVSQTDHGALDFASTEAEANRILVGNYASALEREQDKNRAILYDVGGAILDEAERIRQYSAELNGAIGNAAIDEIDKNREFTAQTLTYVGDQFQKTQSEAFSFAGQSVSKAFTAIESAQDRSYSLLGQGYSEFLDSLKTDTQASYNFINESEARTFQLVDKGFSSILDQSKSLLNGLALFTSDIVKQQSTNNAATVAAVSEATRSDAAQSFDKLITAAAWVVGALAVGSFALRLKSS